MRQGTMSIDFAAHFEAQTGFAILDKLTCCCIARHSQSWNLSESCVTGRSLSQLQVRFFLCVLVVGRELSR